MNVQQFYDDALATRGFRADAAQRQAVARLQCTYDEWVTYKSQRSSTLRRLLIRAEVPRGIYMWGGASLF